MSTRRSYLRRRPTIVHLIHSLTSGGTERMLVALLHELPKREHRHVVVALRGAGELAAQLPDHVSFRPLGIQGRLRRSGLRLALLLRSLDARLIHARNTGCWGDAVVAGVLNPGMQLVLGFHGLEHEGRFPMRTRSLARAARALGGTFTTVSSHGRDKLVRECNIPRSRIRVIGNGVDLSRFMPFGESERLQSREQLGFGSEHFVFGTTGNLVPIKRHDRLIEAFARVADSFPEARLLIAGDGPCRERIEQAIRQFSLSNRIRLAGHCTDVHEVLSAMDGWVCSSDSEGVSNAMLEALAAGLPVVTTDVGDHAVLVRHGHEGLVVSPGSAEPLATAMAQIIKNPKLRSEMALAARRRASEFPISRCVESYSRLYDELLSGAIRSAHRVWQEIETPPTVCPMATGAGLFG